MFLVFLKFSHNKSQASQHMDGHKNWLQAGFDDDVFLAAGSLKPNLGGGIIANNITLPELEARVAKDPFVAESIVSAEIIEMSVAKTDERLSFLLG